MEIIGNIHSRTPAEQKTESFRVQEFILDASYFDNYSGSNRENYLPFQVTGNKIDEFANVPDGARVKVLFSPRGRFYEKRDGSGRGIAMNLEAWKFEIISAPQNPAPQNTNQHY